MLYVRQSGKVILRRSFLSWDQLKCTSKAREEQKENIPGKGDTIRRGPVVGRSSHSYRNKAEAGRAVT